MSDKKITKAVFPVAGLGTRFLPATKTIPKEMIPIVSKPAIHYTIHEAVKAGLEHIILVTSNNKKAIEDYLDKSVELESLFSKPEKAEFRPHAQAPFKETPFSYTRQLEPLGLGHAIWTARDLVGDEYFAVFLGDDILYSKTPAIKQMMNLLDEKETSCSVVALKRVTKQEASSYGIVGGEWKNGKAVLINYMHEKATAEKLENSGFNKHFRVDGYYYAILGRYILAPKIMEIIDDDIKANRRGANNEFQLTDAMLKLSQKEPLYGLVIDGISYDVGTLPGYLRAMVDMTLRSRVTYKGKRIALDFAEYLKTLNVEALLNDRDYWDFE